MLEQVGPKRLWRELKAQAPQYAKLLPQLPRLMHDFLQQPRRSDAQQLQALLIEQRRTNALLQILLYLALGFVTSLFILLVWTHLGPYF